MLQLFHATRTLPLSSYGVTPYGRIVPHGGGSPVDRRLRDRPFFPVFRVFYVSIKPAFFDFLKDVRRLIESDVMSQPDFLGAGAFADFSDFARDRKRTRLNSSH